MENTHAIPARETTTSNADDSQLSRLLKTLGPGLLFASTAIGVSHLVQSTRAGASYGYALLWAVIIANLLKYPSFEYGSRYANATGESLIDGYKRFGNWALYLYLFITVSPMSIIIAAICFTTAGLLNNLLGLDLPVIRTALFLIVGCVSILLVGKVQRPGQSHQGHLYGAVSLHPDRLCSDSLAWPDRAGGLLLVRGLDGLGLCLSDCPHGLDAGPPGFIRPQQPVDA